MDLEKENILPGSETAAIDLLQKILGKSGRREIKRDIGDDCAVISISSGHDILLTVDTVVRDVHFCVEWQSGYGIGWRALASSVSDIAAMSGEPMAGVIAIGADDGWDDQLKEVYRGISDLSSKLEMDIVGGDITALPGRFSISITVLGKVEKGKALFRDGACQDDDIWVTGTLGGGRAVRLMADLGIRDRFWRRSLAEYEGILPRIDEARFLSEKLPPSSLIDISDGLSTDLSHICRMSGTGAIIEEDRIPVDEKVLYVSSGTGLDPVELALNGGEDFELCFTVAHGEGDRIADDFTEKFKLAVTKIGRIKGSELFIQGRDGNKRLLKPSGFDHLKIKEREK
jgi:thiamine-monophosphate kinase